MKAQTLDTNTIPATMMAKEMHMDTICSGCGTERTILTPYTDETGNTRELCDECLPFECEFCGKDITESLHGNVNICRECFDKRELNNDHPSSPFLVNPSTLGRLTS